MRRWTIATVLLAVAFYALALSQAVYDATSPQGFAWHVVLRKAYSVGAFSLLGYCFRRALGENGAPRTAAFWACVAGTAAYSGAIEAGQALRGSTEGALWNAIDVACGAAGGAIGAVLGVRPAPFRAPPRR